jgi:hypothetical protein
VSRLFLLGIWALTVAACAHRSAPVRDDAAVESLPSEDVSAIGESTDEEIPADAVQVICPHGVGPEACPPGRAYFFLRVLDRHRMPVPAALAVQPSVQRIVSVEDGYAAIVHPGVYQVQIEAEGFAPVTLRFRVGADEKAFLEAEMKELGQP